MLEVLQALRVRGGAGTWLGCCHDACFLPTMLATVRARRTRPLPFSLGTPGEEPVPHGGGAKLWEEPADPAGTP